MVVVGFFMFYFPLWDYPSCPIENPSAIATNKYRQNGSIFTVRSSHHDRRRRLPLSCTRTRRASCARTSACLSRDRRRSACSTRLRRRAGNTTLLGQSRARRSPRIKARILLRVKTRALYGARSCRRRWISRNNLLAAIRFSAESPADMSFDHATCRRSAAS